MTAAADVTTQPPEPDPTFAKDSACGTSKGCLSSCDSDTSCRFSVSWSKGADPSMANFTFKSNSVSSSGSYIALGLSSDNEMGDDDVIGCVGISTGTVSEFSSENSESGSTVYSDSNVTLIQGAVADGILTCEVQRPVASYVVDSHTRRDLDQQWTLFVARGSGTLDDVTDAVSSLSYHGATGRFGSGQALSVNDLNDLAVQDVVDSGPTDPPVTSGAVQKDPGCGSTKGCYSKCDTDTSCSFTVSWSEVAGSNPALAAFTFKSDIGTSTGGGKYIALGLSTDSKMGDDDVIGCAGSSDGSGAGAGSAFSSQNVGRSTSLYSDSDVILVQGEVVDGVLTCEIRRPVASYQVGGFTRRDLLNQSTLLVARGDAIIESDGSVSKVIYHEVGNRYESGQAVSVQDLIDIGAKDEDFPLIKAHGSLMIGAWVFFASIGIVVARYYKPVLGNSLCSEKQWFQLHRTCMVLAFAACVAGFVVIFVEVEEWVELKETPKYLRGHPIMGTVVTGLCVLNPIMALFRPHPNTKNRPIFNWLHWLVGTGAHILGVITIFFGFELGKSGAPSHLKYILAGYVAWQVLVELTLELMTCCKKKDRQEVYELADSTADLKVGGTNNSSDGMETIKKILLALHVVVVGAISAVLIVLLIEG